MQKGLHTKNKQELGIAVKEQRWVSKYVFYLMFE